VSDVRRERLARSRLYFVTDLRPRIDSLLAAALEGGVDMVQLRDKSAGDEEIVAAARLFRRRCDEHGALFWLNDRPDLALRCEADGVHVGQDDDPPEQVREQVGDDLLIGLSTHAPAQLDAALDAPVDQLSVGPVYATPTKQGRAAAGLAYVAYAAARAAGRPWFAIGGIDPDTLGEVTAAGAERIVVVRAIRDAADPAAAAAALRARLDSVNRTDA
jgi:thiamine-phosphate pyrophosphorylase